MVAVMSRRIFSLVIVAESCIGETVLLPLKETEKPFFVMVKLFTRIEQVKENSDKSIIQN